MPATTLDTWGCRQPGRSGGIRAAGLPGCRVRLRAGAADAATIGILVEQAKGFLAERFTISVEDAFGIMRDYARDHRRKLTDVAAEITAGHLAPGLGDP